MGTDTDMDTGMGKGLRYRFEVDTYRYLNWRYLLTQSCVMLNVAKYHVAELWICIHNLKLKPGTI